MVEATHPASRRSFFRIISECSFPKYAEVPLARLNGVQCRIDFSVCTVSLLHRRLICWIGSDARNNAHDGVACLIHTLPNARANTGQDCGAVGGAFFGG